MTERLRERGSDRQRAATIRSDLCNLVPPAKVFISYSSQDKADAGNTRQLFQNLGAEPFAAHDDIPGSAEWRDGILEALRSCDVFVALLSKAFKTSEWTSQEIGFILSRPDVPVVQLTLDGTVPYGFAGQWQLTKHQSVEQMLMPLLNKFARRVAGTVIRYVGTAVNYREAEERLGAIGPYVARLDDYETNLLGAVVATNDQVWNATACRVRLLPRFLTDAAQILDSNVREILSEQIATGNAVDIDRLERMAQVIRERRRPVVASSPSRPVLTKRRRLLGDRTEVFVGKTSEVAIQAALKGAGSIKVETFGGDAWRVRITTPFLVGSAVQPRLMSMAATLEDILGLRLATEAEVVEDEKRRVDSEIALDEATKKLTEDVTRQIVSERQRNAGN